MGNLALQNRHAAHNGTYNGAEAALDFGDPVRELAILREEAGVFDLSWRTKIVVTGKDRVRWLHNMVTNNIRDLKPDHGDYNFVLNAQGRILGDLYAFNRGESLVFDTDHTQGQPLLSAMKRFIIMDKVEMNESPEIVALGICGPKSEAVLAAAGVDVTGFEPLQIRETRLGEVPVPVVRGPANKPGWYEVWSDTSGIAEVRDKFLGAGALPVGTQALEWWRILQGIPNYGQDIRERDLPQETGQTQALNFNKGCYIGQEIVERIRSRGQVHRRFTGFEFEEELPAPGKFESQGRTIAEITSAARIPIASGEKQLGLGYVREEAVASSTQLDLNGRKARVAELPFAI